MKSIILMATAGLAAFSVATSADAYKFNPPGKRFIAKGPASATLNGHTLSGTGTFRSGVLRRGTIRINKVTFCGAHSCGAVGAAGLPWAMTATGATTATITNVTFTSAAGNCGPANLNVTVSSGVISYNGAFAQCTQVSLALTTTPTVSIVP